VARYLYPQDRLVFRYGAPGTPLYSPQNETLTIFTDQAATIPANLLDPEGGAIDNILDIGADCLIPEFQGPDSTTTVWAKNRADQVYPLYAQTGQFLTGGTGAVTSVNAKVGVVVLNATDVNAYSQSAGTTLAGRVTAVESGRLLVANNLADLNSPSAARAALSLGNAATRSVGTTNSTVAAGDAPAGAITTHVGVSDPHGDRAFATGAVNTHTAAPDPHGDRAASLSKAQNLADLPNPGTARTSLGLGGAAVLSVGTTAGTVAAGNDSRMTNSRTPTAHASSHATAGSDPLTLAQAQITGLTAALAALLPLAGGTVTGSLAVQGSVGFYGTAATAKPTVTGSKASGAALTSLLTALAGLGLITDTTTA
jgi:hypothetical protein